MTSANDIFEYKTKFREGNRFDTSWKPLPGPQTEVLRRREREILYGGARGPGKTEAGLAFMVEPEYINNRYYKGLVVRVNYDDLKDWIDRARLFYEPLGVRVSGNPVVFRFPSGALIRTGHLKDENAYQKYLGHEHQKINFEELTLCPTELLYLQLLSTLRSTQSELIPQLFATTNPGGPGHAWVKRRFVDVADCKTFTDEVGNTRIFIPGHVYDNPILTENDPAYVKFLESIPDENLKKAWLEGSWDVFFGQFFDKWNANLHVIPEEKLPPNCTLFIAIDYGYSAACSALWGAVYPDGKLVIYREYLEYKKPPSIAAQEIKYLCGDETYNRILADPNMWAKHNEGIGKYNEMSTMESPADIFEKFGIYLAKANNSRAQGWMRVKDLMYYDKNRIPRLYIMENCENLIKNIPGAIYSETQTDDINQSKGPGYHQDDLDALRYMVMHIYGGFESVPTSKQVKFDAYNPWEREDKEMWDAILREEANAINYVAWENA